MLDSKDWLRWGAWPCVPLVGYTFSLLALLVLGGTRWSLVPPILEQATPVLLILTLVFRCAKAQDAMVVIKAMALGAWLNIWWTQGTWLTFPLMDDASTLALIDVYFTAILNFWIFLGLNNPATGPLNNVLYAFAGPMDPDISVVLHQQVRCLRRLCLGVGVLAVLAWSRFCSYLDPSTLFPGQSFAEMQRSPAALPVFTLMLLTAMIGFADMGKYIDRECVIRIPEAWQKPWRVCGFATPITLGRVLRAQVQIILAGMWSLHLTGAMALSTLLLLDGITSRPNVPESGPKEE